MEKKVIKRVPSTDKKKEEREIYMTEQQLIISKLSILENLLSSVKPGERLQGIENTNWTPSIFDPTYLAIIEEKIIELVKKM